MSFNKYFYVLKRLWALILRYLIDRDDIVEDQ